MAEMILGKNRRIDGLIAELDVVRAKGREFLDAYIAASVSDEEGLLAASDQREWSAMWQAVDEAAQAFGAALGGK